MKHVPARQLEHALPLLKLAQANGALGRLKPRPVPHRLGQRRVHLSQTGALSPPKSRESGPCSVEHAPRRGRSGPEERAGLGRIRRGVGADGGLFVVGASGAVDRASGRRRCDGFLGVTPEKDRKACDGLGGGTVALLLAEDPNSLGEYRQKGQERRKEQNQEKEVEQRPAKEKRKFEYLVCEA